MGPLGPSAAARNMRVPAARRRQVHGEVLLCRQGMAMTAARRHLQRTISWLRQACITDYQPMWEGGWRGGGGPDGPLSAKHAAKLTGGGRMPPVTWAALRPCKAARPGGCRVGQGHAWSPGRPHRQEGRPRQQRPRMAQRGNPLWRSSEAPRRVTSTDRRTQMLSCGRPFYCLARSSAGLRAASRREGEGAARVPRNPSGRPVRTWPLLKLSCSLGPPRMAFACFYG